MKNTNFKRTFAVTLLTSTVLASISFSQPAGGGRKPISADAHPLGKTLVHINQVGGEMVSYGNGFIVGKDGCHILTNFHVAFGKSKDGRGNDIFVDNVSVGHEVVVQADLNSRTGRFNKQGLKARVVEFGDYRPNSDIGMREDMAMLKLDTCLGKEFGIAKFEPKKDGVIVPANGLISTLSISKDATLKNTLFLERNCVAADDSPIAGVFAMTCKQIGGMSGSMVFNEDADGGFTIVAMSSRGLGHTAKESVNLAIFASYLTPFVESVLGTEATKIPLKIGSKGNDATTASLSSTKGRTVVR